MLYCFAQFFPSNDSLIGSMFPSEGQQMYALRLLDKAFKIAWLWSPVNWSAVV